MSDSNATTHTIMLRDGVESATMRTLAVSLRRDGTLFFEGRDQGAGPKDYWGQERFSWRITIAASQIPSYLVALRSLTRDGDTPATFPPASDTPREGLDVLALIASGYERDPIAVTTTFLSDHDVPHDFWSRVEDV